MGPARTGAGFPPMDRAYSWFSYGYARSGLTMLLQEGRPLLRPEKRGAKLGTGETQPKFYKPKTDRSAFRDERSGNRACGKAIAGGSDRSRGACRGNERDTRLT